MWIGENNNVTRRFGPEFVAEYQRRYGERPPEHRQLTCDITAGDKNAPWRQWLDNQLALLPAKTADALARRIWLDEHFWPVNFELSAGAGLRAAGLRVAYEQHWNRLTPDWTVLSDDNKPRAFVELHTDQPPASTFGQIRAWHGLVERIKAIPVPVIVQVASDGGPYRHRMQGQPRGQPETCITSSSARATGSMSWPTLAAVESRQSHRWGCMPPSVRRVRRGSQCATAAGTGQRKGTYLWTADRRV